MSWPPEDAGKFLERWRELGSPEIALSPGVGIVDLEKWFDPMVFRSPSDEEMDRVRAELGLTPEIFTAESPDPEGVARAIAGPEPQPEQQERLL